MPAVAPPPPRASASSSTPATNVAPPPPRSFAASPAARNESPGPVPPSPTLSRPGTPGAGRPAKPAPTLALSALMQDLSSLQGTDLLSDFGGEVKEGSAVSLADVRAGGVDPAVLERQAAVRLADAFVVEMDGLLERALAAVSSTATVDRAGAVGRWAGKVEDGLIGAPSA
ncbi:hypothetical protein JCM10908_007131 [Rhodotorula pacifica]|uniref:uncharacterized protein n=1 Tax=Rhodotorula pacifica TaxID=1495444 RepID=UPI003173EB21